MPLAQNGRIGWADRKPDAVGRERGGLTVSEPSGGHLRRHADEQAAHHPANGNEDGEEWPPHHLGRLIGIVVAHEQLVGAEGEEPSEETEAEQQREEAGLRHAAREDASEPLGKSKTVPASASTLTWRRSAGCLQVAQF